VGDGNRDKKNEHRKEVEVIDNLKILVE